MRRSLLVRPRVAASLALLCALASLVPLSAAGATPFDDVVDNVHADAIAIVAETAVTQGCREGEFCPHEPVRRDQMARFLQRTLRLPDAPHDFDDVPRTGSVAGAVGAIAAHEPPITRGCGPDRFCPARSVTRGQMATFLATAFDLPPGDHAGFDDVPADHPHHDGIRAIAAADITRGCGADGARFCPDRDVRRDQMASLLTGALGLDRPVGCPTPATPGPDLETLGTAAPGYPVTTALETDDGLLLFPNDLGEQARITRLVDGAVAETIPVPAGRRTWAAVETGNGVYHGQFGVRGDGPNLFRLGSGSGVRIPDGGEFWTLTADAQDRVYAGTRGQLRLNDPDANLVHRYDPATGEVEELTFALPQDRHGGGPVPREDVKQLAWHDGVLVAGTGFGPGSARLLLLEPSSDTVELGLGDVAPQLERGAGSYPLEARDVTPSSILDARTVISLAVSDDWIALGTWAGGGQTDPDARLVVLSRQDPTAPPLVDLVLPDETRVDQITIDGETVAAAAFPSGQPHLVELASGAHRTLTAPVAGAATRSLTLDGAQLRGVAAPGRTWSLDTVTGARTVLDLATGGVPGVPVGRQTTHSLATTDRDVVVGANGEVHLHPSDRDPNRRALRLIPGEAKAIATDGPTAYLANYPSAQLWRTSSDDPVSRLTATRVVDLDPQYNRPRAVAHDPTTGHVVVVAREDGSGQPRPSQVSLVDPDAPSAERLLDATTIRPTGDPAGQVEGLSAVARDGLVVVGDRSGGVRAYDASDGELRLAWQTRPRPVARGVIDLSWEDQGPIVGVLDENGGWFELDPETGELTALGRDAVSGLSAPSDKVQLGPVSVVTNVEGLGTQGEYRELIAIERGHDRGTRLLAHGRGETFGGPLTARDDTCRLHVIVGRDLLRLPYDGRSRLP